MKKICVFLVIMLFIFGIVTSACDKKTKANIIQAKRRFAEYTEPQQKSNNGYVDLSEGPKLNYNTDLGPQKLNFDFKIVDPY